ncbi:MAG: class I SAM-dependent methyltransferase [Sedimenticolaceae bacterium]|nr:class I SAM-dependent methyltransferase [Sedimenticolaceae bacterium]
MTRLIPLLLLILLPVTAFAEQNVNPGINDHYQNPDVSQWRGVFERDGREVWDRRNDIIRVLDLQPGMAIADIGAGTGFFTMLMAREVGPMGKAYAVDIAPEFVKAIELRAQEQGIGNITGIVNDQKSTRLPPQSVDLVFISDTYHHFEYPMTTLQSIHDALRPGGELVVIDFKRIPGFSSAWVMGHVRAGEEQVTTEIQSAGFELVQRLDFMQTQYYLRFRKR